MIKSNIWTCFTCTKCEISDF